MIYFLNNIYIFNIIYKFLVKYKQIIYNIFIAKLYKIVYKFNIRVVIKKILDRIFGSAILLILSKNLKFFYNC